VRADRRGAGLVVGVIAAVALVALASRGDHGGGDRIVVVPSAVTSAWQATILIVLAILVVGAGVLFALSLTANKPDLDRRRQSWKHIVVTIAIVLALAVAMSRARPHADPRRPDRDGGTSVIDGPRDAVADGSGGSPAWGLGAVGALVVVGAVGGVVLSERRRRRAIEPPREPIVATPEERDDAVARARACADPRAAVLLAFAAAEAVLSADAATRRPPATSAREWATRVRRAPLTTIVGRYEVARFSDHAVSARDRDVALGALADLT
jgi:hypothetical protein